MGFRKGKQLTWSPSLSLLLSIFITRSRPLLCALSSCSSPLTTLPWRASWSARPQAKMQSTSTQPVSIQTTAAQNTTTKSYQQILIQSSGAMIAVIVIGIIIILTILLIILKTYNRRTHASRVLAGGPKHRQKSSSTVQTNMPLHTMGTNSNFVSGSFSQPNGTVENGFQLPRVDRNDLDRSNLEQNSTTSGSTVATVHDIPPLDNT
ncbi:noncompact myelin-associated protein-like [Arapaima gigas]